MTPRAQIAAASVALASLIVGSATAARAVAKAPVYTLAATQSCLTALPNAVERAAADDTAEPAEALRLRARARQRFDMGEWGSHDRGRIGSSVFWYGDKRYQGIIVSFFKSVDDAPCVGEDARVVVRGQASSGTSSAAWDQKDRAPSRNVRDTVAWLSPLRTRWASNAAKRQAPKATLAEPAPGRWGGHTRGLSITSTGRGREGADDGCCTREYELTFQILSVTGTLTRATAVYRVVSFKRYEGRNETARRGRGRQVRAKGRHRDEHLDGRLLLQ